jgi:hypothetical protein
MSRRWVMLAVFVIAIGAVWAAPSDDAKYAADISKRADDIIAKLDVKDEAAKAREHEILVTQYRSLRDLTDAKERDEAAIKTLHDSFLKKLSAELTPVQVDQVKDGMTYNVLHVTYSAYCDMLPKLTDVQKMKITEWLTQAREEAMDGGSSKEKHEIFGKYKGKINVYLASEGYDLKKETKAWQERLKARRSPASTQAGRSSS